MDYEEVARDLITDIQNCCQDMNTPHNEELADLAWEDSDTLYDMVGDKVHDAVIGNDGLGINLLNKIKDMTNHDPLIKACNDVIRDITEIPPKMHI